MFNSRLVIGAAPRDQPAAVDAIRLAQYATLASVKRQSLLEMLDSCLVIGAASRDPAEAVDAICLAEYVTDAPKKR